MKGPTVVVSLSPEERQKRRLRERQEAALALLFPTAPDGGDSCSQRYDDGLACTLAAGHGGFHAAHMAEDAAPTLVWEPES